VYLSPYPPKLDPIEQFWKTFKGGSKRDQLTTEENTNSGIGDACNEIPAENLYSFCSHTED
jgi:transposase